MYNDRYGLTQAVIEGRKTMTRREMKKQPITFVVSDKETYYKSGRYSYLLLDKDNHLIHPKYKVGEIVAVSQAYRDFIKQSDWDGVDKLTHTAGWLNKMFVRAELMPHRIKITGIRAERLQDISDEDCLKEGIFTNTYLCDGVMKTVYGYDGFLNHKNGKPIGYFAATWFNASNLAFASLIDKVSGKGTWENNPFVWVYEYELIK